MSKNYSVPAKSQAKFFRDKIQASKEVSPVVVNANVNRNDSCIKPEFTLTFRHQVSSI